MPDRHMPLISVIVPNYNHAGFLHERFTSIRGQSFQDYELIVLDDASTDESLATIRFELKDIPYHLIANKLNSGSPCSQWIKGIKNARGKYIWIAESDDSCTADFLLKSLELMEQGASLTYCRSSIVDEHGVDISHESLYWPDAFDRHRWHQLFRLSNHEFCQHCLINANVIPTPAPFYFGATTP